MLQQETMIARVRALCEADQRIAAAMMYGSFTYGEGDPYSDIEFLLFFEDEAFESIEPRAWLAQIAPVGLLYANESGIQVVIFENLVRGEFHFHRVSEVAIGAGWRGVLTFPSLDATLIVDRTGALTPYLEAIVGPPPPRDQLAAVQALVDGFINWSLFASNVRRRGELARALELLNILYRHLLQLARLCDSVTNPSATAHWLTPSRAAEHDLTPERYARLAQCVAARLTPDDLRCALVQAWVWGCELIDELRPRYALTVPEALCARIGAQIAE